MRKSDNSENKKPKPIKNKSRTAPIKKDFPRIFSECMGIVTMACRKAGIDDKTYYAWRKADPQFAADCDAAHERAGDFVESKLYELVNDKNPSATIFYCKTKLRNRGYVEKTESTITHITHEDDLKNLK